MEKDKNNAELNLFTVLNAEFHMPENQNSFEYKAESVEEIVVDSKNNTIIDME